MDFFRGEVRLLFVKIDDDYIPVGCLTDNSFNESTEFIETTTQDDAGWESSRPTQQSFSVDFSGLQVISTDDIQSYDVLVNKKRNRELLQWKIAGSSNLQSTFFAGFIDDISEGNTVSEFLTFDGSIRGIGKPTDDEEVILFTMDSDSATWDSDRLTFDYNG